MRKTYENVENLSLNNEGSEGDCKPGDNDKAQLDQVLWGEVAPRIVIGFCWRSHEAVTCEEVDEVSCDKESDDLIW